MVNRDLEFAAQVANVSEYPPPIHGDASFGSQAPGWL